MDSGTMCLLFWICFVQITTNLGAPIEPEQPYFKTEEFLRCKGMDCKVWEETQESIRNLKAQIKGRDDVSQNDLLFAEIPGAKGAFEGDVFLTPEQIKFFEERLKNRHKRKLTHFTEWSSKWTLPIKFYVDSEFEQSEIDAIRGATHHFMAQTCITFEELELSTALVEEEQFLYFVKSESGCGTFVGRVSPYLVRPQVIQLETSCVVQWGAIVHEIAHTLGFWHEHQRSDRDKYVSVFPDRMSRDSDPNQFDKGVTRDYLPYDYGSVMHYWAWAFSGVLTNVTIEPLNSLYLHTIGQKVELSFLDAKLANLEYCSGLCDTPIHCKNNGYQNPKDCGKCICPDGFAGDVCDQIAGPEKAECGGTIELTESGDGHSAFIKSPGYDERTKYEDRTECTWKIKVPDGYQVSLKFMDQAEDHFGMYCRYPVCFHYVEVRTNSSDLSMTGPRFCCRQIRQLGYLLPGDLTSEGSEMMVLMRSNYTTTSDSYKQGFRAYVWASRRTAVPGPEAPQPEVPEPVMPNPSPVPAGPSSPKLDVIFVIDSSGSVGLNNWNFLKHFVKTVISRFEIGNDHMKFAFVTFGSRGYINFKLEDYNDVTSIHRKIDTLPYKRESSNIADGLRKTRMELLSGTSGDRPTADNLVILATDGPASAEKTNTQPEATLLKSLPNTKLLIVGISERVSDKVRDDLAKIASSPSSNYTIFADNFQQLPDVERQVTSLIRHLAGDAVGVGSTESSTAPPTDAPASFSWSCDFEDPEVCDVEQDKGSDDFDWLRYSGSTPSNPTGPSSAYTGQYYMYIEASNPRKAEDTATLYLPTVPVTGNYCLHFAYNMHGFHVNRLQVQIWTAPGRLTNVWIKKFKQGPSWYTEAITVYMTQNSKIAFTGAVGTEFSGDIAIDTLSLNLGSC